MYCIKLYLIKVEYSLGVDVLATVVVQQQIRTKHRIKQSVRYILCYREHFASTYRRGLKGKSIMESIVSRIKNERRDLINLSRRGK